MKKVRIMDFFVLAFALLLGFGIVFFFGACGPKEDGSWMACHWAERAVLVLGILCSLLALLKLFCANDGVKLGLSVAIFCISLAAFFVPGRIFSLCKNIQMRCHLLMKPSVLVVTVLLCLFCLLDIIFLFRKVYPKVSR